MAYDVPPSPPHAYLDECVDVLLADRLRRRGFEAGTAESAGMRGKTDEEQIVHATAHESIIITHNAKHFIRLHHRFRRLGRLHAGIVLLPADNSPPRLAIRAAMMLDWIATLGDHRGRLFRWGDLQYQLTQGYRLPGYDEADARLALGQEP